MMDFNLILLLVGLGLLVLVAVFVLLGCFAGLKKELKCTAIAFVVLLLTLLVFGNSSTILDFNGSLLKNFIQGIPSSAETVWDCILALVQTKVPGGAEIFAEGTKSYAFLYSVVSGVARGVMLIIGTLVMFILCTIGLGIYRLVSRIVAHNKAKKRAKAGDVEPQPVPDKVMNDNVLVAQSEAGDDEGVMITANKEPVKPGSGKYRGWAGALAGLRAVIAIIFLFAPVSGVCSILDEISPETETLINESLSGNKQNTAASETILDVVLDFKDSYYDSAVGKFIEGSKFFFGESFSMQLFDSAFVIEGEKNNIVVREEAIVFVDAVNALEGNLDLKKLEYSNIANALDELKNSELLVEAMPVVIETAYYYPINAKGNIKLMGSNESLKDLLFASKQQAAFLELRQVDWDKNIEILLDTVKEAYKLGVLEDDFNFLTMDPEQLSATVEVLLKSDAVNSLLNIAIQTALKLDVVKNAVGELPNADLSDFSWAKEFETIIDIYEIFQGLEITSLNNLDIKALVSEIVNDEDKLEIVVDIVKEVTELQLVNKVGYDALLGYVSNMSHVVNAGDDVVKAVKDLKNVNWSNDINIYVEAAIEALPLIEIGDNLKINVDYLNLDVDTIRNVLDILFTTESFEKLLPIGASVGLNIALSKEKVIGFLGDIKVELDTSAINWKQELTTLVDAYDEFQDLGIKSLEEVDKALLTEILNDSNQVAIVESVIEKVTELQLLKEVVYSVAIEYVLNIKTIQDQGTDLVETLTELKEYDWSKDINVYVDAAIAVLPLIDIEYGLQIKVDIFNLDEAQLQVVVDTLFNAESFEKLLPVVANIGLDKALSNEKVKEIIGEEGIVYDTSNVNWKQDFTSLVNIYSTFKVLDFNSLDDFNDMMKVAKDILNSDEKCGAVESILLQLVDMTIYEGVVIPFADAAVTNLISTRASNFEGILDITKLNKDAWKNDFTDLIAIARNVYEICGLEFKLENIDFEVLCGALGTETVELVFNLNLLDGNENKNQLVIALLKQFNVFDEEQLANVDLSEVIWVSNGEYSEVANFQEILTILGKMLEVKGFDLNNLKFNYNDILADENVYGYAVDLLDVVVDSELILALMPNILDKYVVPHVEKWDDEDATLNQIITSLDSEELVLEVQKLVDVVKAVVDLNVLNYKDEGIQGIDFANTDALRTIVNGIFDSKLLEGYESRVVRILLKVTNVFPDLAKGTFDSVDFDSEQAILIAAIDALEVVLKDENFLTFDENGKFKLDKDFYLKDETLDAFLNTLKALFGEYKEGSSVYGSQIVEILLPDLFEKFVAKLIPEQFDELMAILNIDGANPRLLSDDIRKVIYIAELLIDEKVQSYLLGNDYNFANIIDALQEIVVTVFNLNMVNGSEAELMAWALNYVQSVAKFDVGTFTAEDFANVDWDKEVVAINTVLNDVVKLTNINKISTVNKLIDFIKNKDFLKDEFYQTYNINVIFETIEDIFDLQTIEYTLPVVLEYALNLAKEKNFDVSFLGDNMTGELLVEDVMSLVEALKVAVYDLEILEYKKANWTGELPELEYVTEILDIIVNLNLLENKEKQLLRYLVDKFIPANPYVKASDFVFDLHYDFDADYELIKEALPLIYDLIYANNMTTIEQVKAFFTEKWYMNTDLVKDYNIVLVCDLVELLSDLQLVEQALFGLANNLPELDALTKIGDFSSLKTLSRSELVSDLKTLVSIVRQGLDANLLDYYEFKDLDYIDYEALAGILETVGTLNTVKYCGSDILPEVLNYLVSKNAKLNIDYTFTKADFADVDWEEETIILGQVLVETGALLNNINLDSLSDILLFINHKDYLNSIIYTDANAKQVVNILDIAIESKVIKAVGIVGFEYALDFAKDKGFDITFLKGKLTSDELISDLNVIVEIALNAIEFGAVEYVVTKNINNIDTTYLVNIVALLEELNILKCAQPEWTELVVSKVAPLLKLELKSNVAKYRFINFANENVLLQEAIVLIGQILENENIHSIDEIKQFIGNKDYLDINAYKDEVIANVQDLLVLATESDVLGVHLIELFDYAISLASSKTNFDLSFMNDVVTTSELKADIRKLVEISDYLVEFGIVELILLGDVTINLDPIIEMVPLLEEVNLLTKTNDYIAEIVYNMILPKIGLKSVDVEHFEDIDFAKENAVLVKVLEEAKLLLELENFATVSDVVSFVKNREYLYSDRYEQTFNSDAVESMFRLVQLAVSSELVQLELVPLFNYGVTKLAEKVDVAFLEDSVKTSELVSDVDVLIKIARLAIEFGALEYVFTKDIEVVNLEPVIEIVALLEELNIAKNNDRELTAFVFNFIYDKLGINKDANELVKAKQGRSSKVKPSEFVYINYVSENLILQDVLEVVSLLQADFGLTSLNDIIEFVKNKEYTKIREFNAATYTHALDLINVATISSLVQYSLPTLADFGLDKVSEKGYDFTYLSGVFTGAELANDIRVLAKEAVFWLRDNNILNALDNKAIKAYYFDELAETIKALKDVNILNYEQATLVTKLTNIIYDKAFKYEGVIDESYFTDVNWAVEFDNVAALLVELGDIAETFGVEYDLLSLDGLKAFKANAKNLEIYNDEELLNNFADVLSVLRNSSALLSELEFAEEYLISKLAAKDITLNSIYTSKEGLAEDLATLIDVLNVVYPSNVLGFATGKEELNQAYVVELVAAVESVLNMNLLANSKADILDVVFDKLGINVEKEKLDAIVWDNAETEVIGDLLTAVNDLMVELEVLTIEDVKGINVKEYLTLNYETNNRLAVINAVIKVVVQSELVEVSLFGISEKYLNGEKVSGYADLHVIYTDAQEVKEDLTKLAGAIDAVIELDLCSFLVEGSNIPYEKKAAIETIINNVFTLNYLNNEGRVSELIAKVSPIDTSSVDFSNVNLVSDAQLLIEAYEELFPILTSDEFFLKTKNDMKSITKDDLMFLTNDENMPSVKAALNNILDTTLVTETNGAIFLLVVPLIKKAAPKYYEALDPERLTIDELGDDVKAIFDLVEEVIDADLNGILKGMIFNDDVEDLIANVINTIANLNVLDGRFDDLALVIADDLDSKRVGNYYFDKSLYNLTDVMYKEDLLAVIDIIAAVYDLFEVENIATLGDAKQHFGNKSNITALLKNTTQVNNLENIIKLVTELTFAQYNILPIYNEALQSKIAEFIGSELADVTSVYATSEEMINDIVRGLDVLRDLIDLGAFDALGGAEINFDQADLVKKLLADIALIEYVNVQKQNILEFVDSKVRFDLSQLDVSSMDLVNDLTVFGEMYEQLIPVLLSEHNPFTTVSAIKALTIAKSDLYALIYDYQSIYPSVVTLLSEVSIAPQLVKFAANKVENRLTGIAKQLVEVLDVENASDADIIEDLVAGAIVLGYVEDLDLLRKVLYKEDITVTDNETIAALVASVFELNIIDNKFVELVEVILEEILHLDLTGLDLNVNDVDEEQELIVELVNNGVIVLNDLGVLNLSDVKPLIKDIKNTLVNNYKKLNGNTILAIVDSLAQSELFEQLAIPTYEQKVYPKLSGTLAVAGDISGYSQEQFVEDLALIAEMTNDMKVSGLAALIFDSVTPERTCIPYVERIIRNLCMLNIVEVKKADVPTCLQAVLDKLGLTSFIRKYDKDFDLAKYDLSNVNFKSDADIFASMAQQVYVVIESLVESKYTSTFFADRDAMIALVEMYEISLDTTFVKTFAAKALNAVSKVANKVNATVNEDDEAVLINIANFLYGLVDLGVVGADAIDFTDKDTVNMMVQSVHNSITLPEKAKTLIDKVASRMYAYGVVPFDWEAVSIKSELKLVKELISQVTSFEHEIKLATLVNTDAQVDIDQMIYTISDSSFVEQLFFPFVEGTFKALTLGYTDGEMVYSATLDDVLEYSLPNFWKVVNAVYEITEFKVNNINANNVLANLDAVREIVEVFGTDIMLKDNVAKIIATGIGKYTSHDLSDAQLAKLLAIDFENEVQYSNAFFTALEDTYNNYSFSLDKSMLKDADVVKGLADAIEEVLPSETVKVLGRIAMKIANNRVIADRLGDASEIINDRLNDDAYTDELIVDDLYMFVEILRNAADSGILNNRTEFASWDMTAIRNIVTLCFDTNLANGCENDLAEACIDIIPGIDEYYDSSVVIPNWETEINAIIDVIESLKNDGIYDLDSANVDQLSGTTIEYINDSIILSDILVDAINDKLVELDLDQYYVATKEKLDLVVDWDVELDAIRDLNDILDSFDNGTYVFSEVVNVYNNIRTNTVLVNDIVVSSAEYVVPKMPVVKGYYNDSIVIDNWTNEMDAIVAALEQLDACGVDTIDDPLDTRITGDLMCALIQSKIIVNGLVQEINESLVNNDLDTYAVTADDILMVQTPAKWEKELAALRKIESVGILNSKDNLTDEDRQNVIDAVKSIKGTILCDKVLSESAETLVPKLPVIKNYPETLTGISGDEWSVELHIIIDALDVLPIDITTVENPIETLTGEMMVASLKSKILTRAITLEFNHQLVNLDLPFTVAESDLTSITTAAEWDTELDTILEIKEVLDNYQLGTVTLPQVVTLYNKVVAETVLAEKILVKALDDRGITIA